MERASTALATLLAALAPNMAFSGDPYPQFIEQGYRVDYMVGIGASGLVPLDVDGDGAQEVVFSASAGNARLIAALDPQGDGSFRIRHEHAVVPDDIVRILGRMDADQPLILTVARNGTVREYGGAPFVELRRFQTQPQGITAAVGDLDGDGAQELVVLSSTAVLAYALSDGHLIRSHAAAGFTDMVLAQLDADPALEVVLTGDVTGRVIDGATSAVEWEQAGGFGSSLAAGRLGPGSSTAWAGATWSDVTVYRPWAAGWSFSPPEGVLRIVTAPDTASTDVLVVDEPGGLSVLDASQQLRFRFLNDGFASSGITGADIDGRGRHAIVFASSESWSSIRSMGVLDAGSGQLLGEVFTDTGPYLTTTIADFNGDGRREIAAAKRQSGSRRALVLFDLANGLPTWSSPNDWPSAEVLSPIVGLSTVPRSQGSGRDLALLEQSGNFRLIDGTTLEQKWTVSSPPGSLAGTLALIDYDRDGAQDFVVGSRVGISAGAQLKVLSGRDGATLWQSVLMGDMFGAVSRIVVADASADGGNRQLIAAVSGGLRAYDADSGLLNWVMEATGPFAFAKTGVAESELVLATPNGMLRFYDTGRAGVAPVLLRQFAVSAPLKTLTVLDEDVRRLLGTTSDGFVLTDGSTGQTLAMSSPIPAFSGAEIAAPSVVAHSPGHWQIVVGTDAGMYRFSLVLDESIFSDGLDGT